jgi:transposase
MPAKPKSKTPNKTGRPAKDIPEDKVSQLLQAIRIGNTLDSACAFADLSEGVVKHWLKLGAQEIQRSEIHAIKNDQAEIRYRPNVARYARFHDSVKKAMAEGETRDLTIIAKAAEATWTAAAWRRERMQPEKYSKRVVSHQGPDGGNVKVDINLRREAMEMVEQREKAKAKEG